MLCYCYLCNEYSGLQYFCEDCTKIRRYIQLFKKRPIQILDRILSRPEDKQHSKELIEIKKDIQEKEENLQASLNEYPNKDQVLQELKKRIQKN